MLAAVKPNGEARWRTGAARWKPSMGACLNSDSLTRLGLSLQIPASASYTQVQCQDAGSFALSERRQLCLHSKDISMHSRHVSKRLNLLLRAPVSPAAVHRRRLCIRLARILTNLSEPLEAFPRIHPKASRFSSHRTFPAADDTRRPRSASSSPTPGPFSSANFHAALPHRVVDPLAPSTVGAACTASMRPPMVLFPQEAPPT